jgi:flavorubredoxin
LQIVRKYQEWARQKPEPRAVVIYDTMWNATERMAKAIGEGLDEAGTDHKIFNAAITDLNDMIVEIFKARLVVIGSSTHNNGLLPSIMPLIEDMVGQKFKNKVGAAFGSYGWSGEGVKAIEKYLHEAGIPLAKEGLRCKWQPGLEELAQCRAFGKDLAAAAKQA